MTAGTLLADLAPTVGDLAAGLVVLGLLAAEAGETRPWAGWGLA